MTAVARAVADVAAGRMVVVVGAVDGQLVMAAEHVSAEAIAFMTRRCGGPLGLALTAQRCDDLGLVVLDPSRDAQFTTTIDARRGLGTGANAADRAATIRAAADPRTGRDDFVVGGHVQPLRTRDGGVLALAAPGEAAVDLARLAGRLPAAITCAIHNDAGTPAGTLSVAAFARAHGLTAVAMADLVAHRRRAAPVVERVVTTSLPTRHGTFAIVGYRCPTEDTHHVALLKGDVSGEDELAVHVHVECLTSDVFHSLHCDCRERLAASLEAIEADGRGVVLYLTRAAHTRAAHRLTCPDARRDDVLHAVGAEILADLRGVGSAQPVATRG